MHMLVVSKQLITVLLCEVVTKEQDLLYEVITSLESGGQATKPLP